MVDVGQWKVIVYQFLSLLQCLDSNFLVLPTQQYKPKTFKTERLVNETSRVYLHCSYNIEYLTSKSHGFQLPQQPKYKVFYHY